MQPLAGAGSQDGCGGRWRAHPLWVGEAEAPCRRARIHRRAGGDLAGVWPWRLVGVGLLAIALLAGAVYSRRIADRTPDLAGRLDALAVRAGLGVRQVWLMGLRATPENEIFAALDIERLRSTLGYDVVAARRRIEALPWVARASVTRLLPDTLDVRIAERRPYAVWRHRDRGGHSDRSDRGDRFDLIDVGGRVLGPIASDARTDLPLVAGEGAAKEAQALLVILADYPQLRRRLSAAIRVGGRRWTLKLLTGPEIHLPAGDPRPALRTLAGLETRQRLLERDIRAVDLRIPGKIAVRLPAVLARRLRASHRIGAEAGAPRTAGRG